MPTTVKQPSARPTNKALAGTLGASVGVVIAAALGGLWEPLDQTEVRAAVASLVAFGLAYMVKDRPNVG